MGTPNAVADGRLKGELPDPLKGEILSRRREGENQSWSPRNKRNLRETGDRAGRDTRWAPNERGVVGLRGKPSRPS